jgi:hypothetical protein
MPESFPLGHVGHFLIGTGQPGALSLNAVLTVPQSSSTVTGTGVLTQETNPPLNATTHFHGLVTVLVFGGSTKQVYSLSGAPQLIGAAFVINLHITLDGIWGTEGKATYIYTRGGQTSAIEVKDVPVKVRWLLQE